MSHNFKKLLAVQGGGVRGIVSAIYLERLARNGHLDLGSIYSFSGTSTGSIIVSQLVKPSPLSPSDLVDAYKLLAKEIFHRSSWRPKWLDLMLFGAPYDSKRLREILGSKDFLGDLRVGDMPRKFAMVIWDIDHYRGHHDEKLCRTGPLIVHNHASHVDAEMLDYKMADVITGSCSAHAYFPIYTWTSAAGKNHRWTDGGVVDNSSALSNVMICRSPEHGEEVRLDEMVMLSVGNGGHSQGDHSESLGGWKTPHMLRSLVNTITDGNVELTREFLRNTLQQRYCGVDARLPKDISLDDVSQFTFMEQWARDVSLTETENWLRGYFL